MAHDNWYTPKEIIEPIRQFYGGTIDYDLASCQKADQTIDAYRYFTIDKPLDPMSVLPHSTIWCNPPYCGKGTIQKWLKRLIELSCENNQIIALLNRSDAKWYYDFLDNHQGGYYQFRNRIKFIDGVTGEKSSPRYSNDLLYWGNNPKGFKDMCLNNFGKSVPQSFYIQYED